MVVYGKLYRNDGYQEGGGRGWEGNNSRSGVYAWGNQVNECCDFGLVGSDILILATDIPRLSRVQSRIDPNKRDGWLQMRKWGLCRRTLQVACCVS
jgi:hypothetical protein